MFAQGPTRVLCPGYFVVPGLPGGGIGHREDIVCVRRQFSTELPDQIDLGVARIGMAIGRGHRHRSR